LALAAVVPEEKEEANLPVLARVSLAEGVHVVRRPAALRADSAEDEVASPARVPSVALVLG
jgi:hypothetical protein